MVCRYCGKENGNNAVFCENCGGKMENAAPVNDIPYYAPDPGVVNDIPYTADNGNNDPYSYGYGTQNQGFNEGGNDAPYIANPGMNMASTMPAQKKRNLAVISLVLGIIGSTICMSGIVNVAGIVCGISAVTEAKAEGKKCPMGIAGIVLSAFGIVFGAILGVVFYVLAEMIENGTF